MDKATIRKKSLAYLLAPHVWPSWPRCPVIRRDPSGVIAEIGVVLAMQPHVLLCNIFDAKLEGAEAIKYECFSELVNDGWEVD